MCWSICWRGWVSRCATRWPRSSPRPAPMAAGIAMAIMGIIMRMVTIMGTITTAMIDAQALGRLLRLASPMLPVGAYGYSGGLEAAIESGIVHDPASTQAWVQDVLELYLARYELPILWRMQHAWA